MIATSDFLTALECTKFVFGRGSAPDPTGGAHDAPSDPLVGWGGGYPLPIPHPLDAFDLSTPPAVVISPQCLGVWIKHCSPRKRSPDGVSPDCRGGGHLIPACYSFICQKG